MIDFSDPMGWLAAGGTASGILGNIYGGISSTGAYNDMLKAAQMQQRSAQARQDQAIQWMRDRESQMQALSQKPLDIASYQSPMQAAQIAAIRRQVMSQMAGNLPPDLSERMFTTEILPQMIQAQYMQAAGLAQSDRQNQLAALGLMPGAQAQAQNPLPGMGQSLYAMAQYPRGAFGAGGDVSSFGNYLKTQQTRSDQLDAQRQAKLSADRWATALENLRPVRSDNLMNNPTDPHRDRIGTPEYQGIYSSETEY